MKVHSAIGIGYREKIYQNALEVELMDEGFLFEKEFTMPVYYKNTKVGYRRVDFLIDNKITVELKATHSIDPIHIKQALNYLEALDLEIGLLINFGAKSLQFKRLHNSKLAQQKQGNPIAGRLK